MQQVHSQQELADWFDWASLRDHEIPLWYSQAKGVPTPPEVRATGVDRAIP